MTATTTISNVPSTDELMDREPRERDVGFVDPPDDSPREIRSTTLDDLAANAGSVVASLALVWLVYDQLLGLDGLLGFLGSWFVTYLAFYVAVSVGVHPRPIVLDRVAAAVIRVATAVAGVALTSTIVYVFVKGWPALRHLNFYTQDMSGVRPTAPLTQGGVLHAIVGTLITIGIAAVIALPLGVGTAVYMTEVGGKLADAVRSTVDAMTAMPDILAGLFVYAFLIITLGWEKNGLAVSVALVVTMVPVIARSAEVVLSVVPGGLREAGLALGSSSWSTVRHVVLPTARMGIASSLILGIARVTGETAPLLIVSGATTFLNVDPLHEPMNSLPLFIFTAVRSGQEAFIQRGYGAAALLLAMVLVLFILARVVGRGPKVAR